MLCFLNDDTNMIAPDWLDEMTALALRPDVGVVGARLLYGDGTIQHAGVLLGAFALTHHLLQGRPADFRGYRNRGLLTHAVSAVTAACAVDPARSVRHARRLRRALPAAYNDIDLCLAAGARGRYNVIVNRPLVHHFESASRGYYLRPEQEAADRDALHYLLGKVGRRRARAIPSTIRTSRSIGRTTRSRIRRACPRSGPCGSPLPRRADRRGDRIRRNPHLATSGDVREASTPPRRPISASLQAGEQR